jgi:peptidylprolyl isomerase
VRDAGFRKVECCASVCVMKRLFLLPLLIAAAPVARPIPTPNEIVAEATDSEWVAIAPSDLLLMVLAADAQGRPRRVIIQLMPRPFSQGWIGNIRKLATARWWDGTSINRVQDNYVVQWGDGEGENPKKAKPLPPGLSVVSEVNYTVNHIAPPASIVSKKLNRDIVHTRTPSAIEGWHSRDSYSGYVQFHKGWPIGVQGKGPNALFWPLHCYGMVGAGRDMPPDTGTGAELYAVIGHAPRHLDRNIALVGRVIEGIEHLSSLPRGTGPLGFYEKIEERVPILSIKIGSEAKDLPGFEYLSTKSQSFVRYSDARANRSDAFFVHPAGGIDICNIPVPVRRKKQ